MTPLALPRAAARAGSRALHGRGRLAKKLAVAFLGVVAFVLIVNGGVNTWLAYHQARRAALEVEVEMARSAAERVGAFLSDIETQLGWTTGAEWGRTSLDQQRYDFIRLLREAPAVTALAYIDGQGKEQIAVSRLEPDSIASGKDFSGDPRFVRAVADKVWFGPVEFRRGSEPYMTIAMAHAGKNSGVTVADVNLKLVWDVITSIHVGDKGLAYVLDEHGRLIAHPDLSLVLRDSDFSHLPQVAMALAARPTEETALPHSGMAEFAASLDGASVLTAYSIAPKTHWIVFVQQPLAEALAQAYGALWRMCALLALGLILALIVGSLVARRLVEPIDKLREGAERIGAGDLSHRIDVKTGDELETLAGQFNRMADRIREGYETLEAKVAERTRDLEESLAQQTATADVLKAISRSAFDLDTVLETLIASALRLCDADRGQIFRRHGDVYRYAASQMDVDQAYREHERKAEIIPGRGTLVGRVALEKRSVKIADAWSDPEYAEKDKARIGHVRAMLGVPLMRDGEPIGAFALARSEPMEFTERQIELVTTFADQAVIAIENARLFEEVQARTRDLEESLSQQTATADVLKIISRSAFDLDAVFSTLLERAAGLCGSNRGIIFLRRGDRLAPAALHGMPDATREALIANPLQIDQFSAGGRAVLTRDVAVVADVALDHAYKRRDLAAVGQYRAIIGVPLMQDGEAIGAFSLPRAEPGGYTPRQIETLRTFADQAVIAIENARLFNEVQAKTRELQQSLNDLGKAQDRLVQSEKLASLGQLTAGIAHEIKNPLNFVNNFAALSRELLGELKEILGGAPLNDKDRDEVEDLVSTLDSNLDKVAHHGKRADSIVKNMLLHSREGSGERTSVNVNAMVEEALNLGYHGARAEKPGFNVTLEKDFDDRAGLAEVHLQEITRVLLNLISNGFYAASKRKAADEPGYEPTLRTSTRDLGARVEIRIRDNGAGIPEDVRAKMFNPFFTTKPAGEGTGLGLSLSHDIIVKQHGGTIEVETELGDFTEFVITLPRHFSEVAAAKGVAE